MALRLALKYAWGPSRGGRRIFCSIVHVKSALLLTLGLSGGDARKLGLGGVQLIIIAQRLRPLNKTDNKSRAAWPAAGYRCGERRGQLSDEQL